MSVLIKNMNIPKTCRKCPFCQFGGFSLEFRCLVTGESIISFDVKEKRAGNCPLTELPTHGDLIDVGNLIKDIGEINNKPLVEWLKWLIECAAVVIEAEEVNDNECSD